MDESSHLMEGGCGQRSEQQRTSTYFAYARTAASRVFVVETISDDFLPMTVALHQFFKKFQRRGFVPAFGKNRSQ